MNKSTYHVHLDTSGTILAKRGLLPGGVTQKFFTNEVIRISNPYVPMMNNILATNIAIGSDGTYYEHISPYARYHWYGLLMVGPAPKQLTNIPMVYNGAPMRGPKWTERAWVDHGDSVLHAVQQFVNRGGK
ncbi:minor capsid protein [Breznakia sp. OttesenSCG-928-G09]|nr:minor capsid protein [Breznakia sp. OttesenSCG-928-G09]